MKGIGILDRHTVEFIDNMGIFLLVLTRVTGLFVIAPIFGRKNIPTYFKIGFAFFIALIIFNAMPISSHA